MVSTDLGAAQILAQGKAPPHLRTPAMAVPRGLAAFGRDHARRSERADVTMIPPRAC